jgi:putative membrane protein
MLRDALLAWAHFICVFAFVGVVAAEIALYRRQMGGARLAQLQRVDLWYGIIAALVIVSGVARVTLGLKGPGFYLSNPVFWTKMTLFVIVGLLSIAPTMHYLRVRRIAAADGSVAIDERTYATVRRVLLAEGVLLVFIPLCATLLAHGYH